MRSRAVPRVGGSVVIVFLAERVPGVIECVEDEQRRLQVLTSEGERLTFTLNRALGTFVSDEGGSRARLVFGEPDGG